MTESLAALEFWQFLWLFRKMIDWAKMSGAGDNLKVQAVLSHRATDSILKAMKKIKEGIKCP